MNFVAANKAKIVGSIWIDGNHETIVRWREENIEALSIAAIEPLHVALAGEE